MVQPAADFPDFTHGILLLGVDGDGNQVGVLLDSDGNLNCILKGQGTEGLETIAVDSEGRIEVFILDSESQWGDVLRVGNAEMAARLGSPRAWDWRGQTLHFNDFSRGMGNVLKYPSGAGSAVTVDPTYWITGGYSVKLVAGSDSDHYARVDFLIEHPPSLRMGLEASFSYEAQLDDFKIEMRRYLDNKIYWAAVRFNRSTSRVQYLDSDGNWQDIANPFFLSGEEQFHRLKVVADFSTFKYVRVLYADAEYDASDIDLYQWGAGYLSTVYCEIRMTGRSGNNDVAYLDSYVVTVGEPT